MGKTDLPTPPGDREKLDDSEQSNVYRIHAGLAPRRPLTIISESGLYKLVLRSNKPEAKQFQDWVTKVVLPAIRKDGAYVVVNPKHTD